jgi:serine/threonine-protein kinase
MIREGELLAGKYRVERTLGAGGMGYVVAATHEQLGQRVAVKLLVPELCENEESVTRFLREARAAVRIQSEHVARVIDVGELPSGGPYMVMEFLNGRDLAEVLDQPQQLEIAQAIDYVLQASEAVAEAHSLGVIHRDLKPANLFLTQRPDGSPLVKVLDFGISKAISPEDSAIDAPSLTATHSLLGSPAYMSPEQIRRPKTVDARTDIWSLGSILYELLTKEAPFQADTPLALLAAVVSDPLPRIRDRRPDIPAELEAVINKCLQKNPADRYQTVAELAEALAPFAARTSLPSVSRIAGILRASQRPSITPVGASSKDATLRSEGPELAAQDTQIQHVEIVATAGSNDAKRTHTDWESSQSESRRSRQVAMLAGGVLIAGTIAALVYFQEQPALETTSAAEPPSAAPRAAVAEAVLAPPVAPPTVSPSPNVSPSPAAAASGSAHNTKTQAPAAKAVAPAIKANVPPVTAPRLDSSASSSVPAAPAAAAASDPLDGRR